MDDRTETYLVILGCTAFGGVVGAAFGGCAGALSWNGGRAAGTALGLAVARAVSRVSGVKPSPAGRGALVGAVDGLLFLGVVALVTGLLLRRFGQGDVRVLSGLALAGLALSGAAFAAGILAYALLRAGIPALALAFALAVLGAWAGLKFVGWPGFLAGGLGGLALGTAGSLLFPHRQPDRQRPADDNGDESDRL